MVHIGVEFIGNSFLRKFPNLETLNLEGNYLYTWNTDLDLRKLKSLYLASKIEKSLKVANNSIWNFRQSVELLFRFGMGNKAQPNCTISERHSKFNLLWRASCQKIVAHNCPICSRNAFYIFYFLTNRQKSCVGSWSLRCPPHLS